MSKSKTNQLPKSRELIIVPPIDLAPETQDKVLATGLTVINNRVLTAIAEKKEEADKSFSELQDVSFEEPVDREDWKRLENLLKELKGKVKVIDSERKKALEPLTKSIGEVQKSVSTWAKGINTFIAGKETALRQWGKEQIEKEDAEEAAYEDERLILDIWIAQLQDHIPRMIENAYKETDPNVVQKLKDSQLRPLMENLEELKGQWAEEMVMDDIGAVILSFSGCLDLQIKLCKTLDLKETSLLITKKKQAFAELRESILETIPQIEGILADHKKPKLKPFQYGMRQVLKVDLDTGALDSNSDKFDIDIDIMDDPGVRNAITKCIADKIKQDGVKPGDDLDGLSFGESVSLEWTLK